MTQTLPEIAIPAHLLWAPPEAEETPQPQTAAELLDAAADLIEPFERWTRIAFARLADGTACSPTDPSAAQWCGFGALMRMEPEWTSFGPLDDAVERALARVFGDPGPYVGLAHLNEHADLAPEEAHALVVGVLRVAARLAEQEEAST